MEYELMLENYSGPLDKLLELVEEKKMEITLVSLAHVTGDFLNYLKKLEAQTQNHSLIADFLVIASKLLLIKSKILIPSLPLEEEEKADINALERRLKIYRELKKTQIYIKSGWGVLPKMMSREFLLGLGIIFYPPASLKKEQLQAALIKILGDLEKIFKPKAVIKNEIVSLQSKIKEVLRRLGGGLTSLNKLQSGQAKSELIILFLAVLHLLKDQLIYAEQSGHFEDIKIAKNR